MKNKPPYALSSVDNALLLLQMLRDHGGVRVADAAEELGIARSTAHRLLAMLVYRDFAVQDGNRNYVPGPALAASRLGGPANQHLRKVLQPHLEALCERVGETTNLMVRMGTQCRFLASVESPQVLQVGDRRGTILPAHACSGGKALLAELETHRLEQLYRREGRGHSLDEERWRNLLRELRAVREQGYALNREVSETGVCAIGVPVHDESGAGAGAISVSAPAVRFEAARVPEWAAELHAAAARAEEDLRAGA
ncbi:IclR family transcriptional regulator [Salinifilum ghardaiensis]